MAQKHTDQELRELSLNKRKEQANAAALLHKILDGRYKPEQEAEERESKGKFFGAPRISPHCETP